MMESKKTKKSRSYGEQSKSSDPARSSLTSTSSSRPSHKERVKSAPLIPQSLQQQSPSTSRSHTTTKRESHNSEPSSGALSPPYSPINRNLTYSSTRHSAQSQFHGPGEINEVVIAVLGVGAVGKSMFVQLALDLKKVATSAISSKKVSLEGSISVVRLIEVDVEDVEIEDESLLWPDMAGEQPLPSIDGALVMYNVLDQSSIIPLPPVLSEFVWSLYCIRSITLHMRKLFVGCSHTDQHSLLDALSKDRVPTIVVASRCDHPPKSWRVDHGKVEKLCNRFEGVECFQTSISLPDTHKRCLSIILRNVMLERNGE